MPGKAESCTSSRPGLEQHGEKGIHRANVVPLSDWLTTFALVRIGLGALAQIALWILTVDFVGALD